MWRNKANKSGWGNLFCVFLKFFTVIVLLLFIAEFYLIRSTLHEADFEHLQNHQIHQTNHILIDNNVTTNVNNQSESKPIEENGEEEGEIKGGNWVTVLLLTLLSSLAAGLGGVPFFFVKELSPLFLSLSYAIASGLMLSACLSLVIDGWTYSPLHTILGFLVGLIFIVISEKMLEKYEDIKVAGLAGIDAKRAMLFVAVMTVHSFAEGVGMGMSFGGGHTLGLCVCIAIAIHNIPEGIAVCLVLLPKGLSPLHSSVWSAVTSLPQPLMALPAYFFVEQFLSILPWGLGFSSGAMIYMVISELIPDALATKVDKRVVFSVIGLAFILMSLFQFLLELLLHTSESSLPIYSST